MEEERISKKCFKRRLPYHKTSGKTKKKIGGCGPEGCITTAGVRGWRRRAENSDEWRRLIREAKARKGHMGGWIIPIAVLEDTLQNTVFDGEGFLTLNKPQGGGPQLVRCPRFFLQCNSGYHQYVEVVSSTSILFEFTYATCCHLKKYDRFNR
jgi:hypothetical protein